ncbi:discoidin domain-containing protein [Dactylosporangium sp. NPDC006015]|uniref:discoidin domain-containing protein n=1 Tax=Dactylosporangium sp. NPDC006015 TaxID=3154576 RepID=UPI00339FCCFD
MPRQVLRLVAAGAAVAVGLTGFTQAQAGEAAPSARVWVTTVDQTELMHERAPIAFTKAAAGNPNVTITVDPSREYQTMDGFGASITDSSAAVLYRLSATERDKAIRALFDPAKGDGVSFLRQPIGSSDFTAASSHYSLDDVPAGQKDWTLSKFSIARDQAQILPLLRRAKQLNPQLKIMATPWSPPAWMKANDSLVGGSLIDDPKIYAVYAAYLTRFVLAYTAAGVPIDYITVQNEPQNGGVNGYPTTAMRVAQEAKVIEILGPLLRLFSPRTKIIGYDHNWATHPNDVVNVPPGQDPETDYPYQLLRSPAAKWLAGTAYHCYYGEPAAQTALHDAFPTKGIWFTECSGSHGANDTPAQFFRDTLKWHARTIAIGTTRNWAKSAVNWNIALDSTNGPHLGGCDTCTGLITVQPDGTFTTNAEYYTIGHLSRFVKPGAVRIASTSFGTTGWNGQIMDVAFRNPDGSTALVVHNENDDPRTFTVAAGDRTFDYTLPGGSLATFTWPRSRVFDDGLRLLPLKGATATSLPASASADAKLAVDEDASTRWSAGQAQEPGQYLQVDLGGKTSFRRVAIDSGGSVGDYARSWELSVSDDGTSWRVVASGTGTGQLTNVDVQARARYVRVTNTGSSGSWWSLADIRLYA